MKRAIVVVGGREEIGGFRLAGVLAYDMGSPGLIERLAGMDAVILVSETAVRALGEDLERLSAKNIVQRIPEGGSGYKLVRDIIIRTVGFDLA